ncbi:MAG: hypothetical protein LBB82_00075 [Treponema sp.]|jgi:hypothetical protein|nr:hypothetical protein [Treponema sp.]
MCSPKFQALVLAALVFGCAHEKEAAMAVVEGPVVPPLPERPLVRPVDYRGREAGLSLPAWLRTYLNGERTALEAEIYALSYAFISENRNTRLPVINQWLRNFRIDYDVSRLIAARIRSRFDQNLQVLPDEVYGRNYQAAVKAAYATVFWGARREDDCWILDSDGVYHGYILILVPRDTLEIQIKALMSSIKTDSGRDQDQAFKGVVEHFFENF